MMQHKKLERRFDSTKTHLALDGGVDLILPDDVDIAWLALAHSDWLSSYGDGY